MVTDKLKEQVRFCENWLHIIFDGDIESEDDVKDFLIENLDDALEVSDNALECYNNEING